VAAVGRVGDVLFCGAVRAALLRPLLLLVVVVVVLLPAAVVARMRPTSRILGRRGGRSELRCGNLRNHEGFGDANPLYGIMR